MSSSFRRAALIAPGILTLAALTTLAQTTSPTPGPAWGAGPPTSSNEGGGVTIMLHNNMDLVALGRTGCPIAVLGSDVWNLQTQKKSGITIPHNANRDTPHALSDDGTLLVVGRGRSDEHKGPSQADATVWNTQTGAQVCAIPSSERDLDVDYLALAADQYVLICGRPSGSREAKMEVWDAKTGKLVRRFPCNFRQAETITVSPDGRYLAVGDPEQITLYEIASGRQLGLMAPPKGAPTGIKIDMNQSHVYVAPTSIPFLSIQALVFSPDGNELAAAGRGNHPSCIAWDHEGKLTANFLFPLSEFDGSGPFLQWAPDRSAWLINQHWLVDRQTQRPVWTFPLAFGDHPQSVFIDDKHLFVLHSSRHNGEVLTVPWDAIHKASDAMAKPATQAWLKPGEKVSIEVAFVHPVLDKAQLTQSLTAGITRLLAENNIQVADNQPAVISLSLDEVIGQPQPIFRHSGPFGQQTVATGRQASPCKGILTVTLHARGSSTPIFTRSALGQSSGGSEKITDSSLQNSMIDFIFDRLKGSHIPYFVSKDTPPLMLPMGAAPADTVSRSFLKSRFSRVPLEEYPDPESLDPRRQAPQPAHEKSKPPVRM